MKKLTQKEKVSRKRKEYNKLIKGVKKQKAKLEERGLPTAAIDKILAIDPFKNVPNKYKLPTKEKLVRLERAVAEIKQRKKTSSTYTIKGAEEYASDWAMKHNLRYIKSRRYKGKTIQGQFIQDLVIDGETIAKPVSNELMGRAMNVFHNYYLNNYNLVNYRTGTIDQVYRWIVENGLTDSDDSTQIELSIMNEIEQYEHEDFDYTYDPTIFGGMM